ncbi:hypothetical protein [Bosea sp. BIWAKO-01]|uniref:hypothetical protein n=1 Tax=Bosea sp. BIWAKO-01 TaxID=506668 RepID=UPI00085399BB|nr:hypothetical protein [Bosea sp. BIWAKO-01]
MDSRSTAWNATPGWGEIAVKMTLVVSSVLLGMLGLGSTASAQSGGTRPECRGVKNTLGCNCALSNGGSITADPDRPGKIKWNGPSRRAPAYGFHELHEPIGARFLGPEGA